MTTLYRPMEEVGLGELAELLNTLQCKGISPRDLLSYSMAVDVVEEADANRVSAAEVSEVALSCMVDESEEMAERAAVDVRNTLKRMGVIPCTCTT